MKNITKLMTVLCLSLSYLVTNAQIKNAKIETIKIFGNCGMCERVIEKSGSVKKISNVDWNQDSKMATITYDEKKTNKDEILKRIALAGYDNESFLAPDDVYAKLPECCQYDRVRKTDAKIEMAEMKKENNEQPMQVMQTSANETNQLNIVFDNYFAVKDALVQTNGTIASDKSSSLLKAIKGVDMDKLSMDVHMVWMNVMKALEEDAEQISKSTDATNQRRDFMRLSKNMFALMKVAKYEQPVYYQFCPMANDGKGANWLSKDNMIKNPYYGSQMLNCGSTLETIN